MYAVTGATAQQLLLSLVITVVSVIVFLKLPRFLTWLRDTKKLPLSILDAIDPVLRYSTAFIGLMFLVLTLSLVIGSYDVVSLYLPSVAFGSVLASWREGNPYLRQ